MRYYKTKYSDDSNPFWFEVVESTKLTEIVTEYEGYIVDKYGLTRQGGVGKGAAVVPFKIKSSDLYYMKPADLDESGELKVL